ncbi:peptidoglycan/LPS O-acetylase OafA/YrhL [Chitinophaga dinghuensis]|uniref:Peptidoglycan/LPS O-acetylase OafA/YrhL n=2 Tax=Chitinophaga dinghuensis TaxID=1539050 RepID=A0A327VQ54_9BACT|nr:peptidoglycan/LPS O-acetylase OafA/YrhL [Chitinophaga dinghuensis]
MTPVSLLPIIPILILIGLVVLPVSRLLGIQAPQGKYRTIDGLRGYLAFFVFLHHSVVWYYFLHTGSWSFPPSALYHHLGPGSVSFFFMITAFLFFSKLMDAREKGIDWSKLYISRFLRILPLYFFLLILLFLITGIVTGWKLNESPSQLLRHIFGWLLFMEPNLNGVTLRLVIAGVIWSLAFEWLFYFSLPFWGLLLFRLKPSAMVLLFAAAGLALFVWVIYSFYPVMAWQRMSAFIGGMLAAYVVKLPGFRETASHWSTTIFIIGLLYIAIFIIPPFNYPFSLLCFGACFLGIAGGNTLFGLLTLKASRLLGQISYSIYLLHGLLLFSTYNFVISFRVVQQLSPQNYWLMITGIAVVLIIICCITYRFIEKPCLEAADNATKRIKQIIPT